MDASPDKISIRPFLEFIKLTTNSMSKDDLVDFFIHYAEILPANKRRLFMDTLAEHSAKSPVPAIHDNIFDTISDLREEIAKRMESIEDGSYYDEHEDWNHYDDYEPDPLTDEQRYEIAELFKEADRLFVAANLADAGRIYGELFSILETEYDFLNPFDGYIDVDHRETRARHLRCIYETSAPVERVQRILDEIDVEATMNDHEFDIYENNYPLFTDIKNSRLDDLADEEDFLVDWIEALKKLNTDRAHILFLEATFLKKGIDGVKELACQWKCRQPRGYLFWMYIKGREGEWEDVIAIAREALQNLPASDLRCVVAREMSNAAEKLNDAEAVLEGKREIFRSDPDEENMANLIKEAKKQNARDSEIDGILAFLKTAAGKRADSVKELEMKALLMKGELASAFEKRGKPSPLGWSYGNEAIGVLFAGILAAVSVNRIDDTETIRSLLRRYAALNDYSITDEKRDDFISDEILAGLSDRAIPEDEQAVYLAWAEKIGRKRIEAIVGGKHRGAYERAAEVLCGLAECLVACREKKGFDLISEYRDVRYNRYPAFKREVDSVMGKSKILNEERQLMG